jgi:hypothetical protein
MIGSGGATFTATNVFGIGVTTGWSITPPSAGGGGHIIGGWLLKRDLFPSNDDDPMWPEKVA